MTSPFVPVTAFSTEIQEAFLEAGWHPGRQASEWNMTDYPPAIRALVLEWGGLTVEEAGGFVCFKPMGEPQRRFVRQVGGNLYSIGSTQDYWNICVDEAGLVYVICNWMEQVGDSFQEGMTLLLTGKD